MRALVGVLALLGGLTTGACRTRLYDPLYPQFSSRADGSTVRDLASQGDLAPNFTCDHIFVIDGANHVLSAFDPVMATFRDIGRVRCPTSSSPSAMAIARYDDTAWVTFQDGGFFRVSIVDAQCMTTPYREQFSLDGVVGSSFSSDSPGGPTETLFVGGGNDLVLVARDLATFIDRRIGSLPTYLELTGTSAAELWGFFPVGNGNGLPLIARLSKSDASLDRLTPLPKLPLNRGSFTFAFWGGSFWLFEEPDGSTTVFRVDAADGTVATVLPRTGRHIIGSSTSSCAPIGLDR